MVGKKKKKGGRMLEMKPSVYLPSGVVLVSDTLFLWWLTCPICDAIMHGLADRTAMIIDPTCPNCLKMVAGITNPYLLIKQEELESEER